MLIAATTRPRTVALRRPRQPRPPRPPAAPPPQPSDLPPSLPHSTIGGDSSIADQRPNRPVPRPVRRVHPSHSLRDDSAIRSECTMNDYDRELEVAVVAATAAADE